MSKLLISDPATWTKPFKRLFSQNVKPSNTKSLKVGLAVGHGTGPELADIFEKVMIQLAERRSIQVQISRSSKIYHSYSSLLSAGEQGPADSQEIIANETMQDVVHYQRFCEEQALQGTRAIFRTAITAESLYLVRQHLEAVKIEYFDQAGSSIILVRDQAQGFYTGSNIVGDEKVSRSCQFSKQTTGRIISYALGRARDQWSSDAVERITMVYKHHLFGNTFDAWAKAWTEEFGVKVDVLQPDTMNRNMLAFGLGGKRLIIAGNEYADIMEVILLDKFGQGVQETEYAENVYLHPKVFGLSEFQTVHGSADGLVGKDMVNPTATIKAAAAILERYGGSDCTGVLNTVKEAIQTLRRENHVTRDQGGSMSTSAYVEAVLHRCLPSVSQSDSVEAVKAIAPPEKRMSMGKQTALLVIDFQNDFMAKAGTEAEQLAKRTQKVIELARRHHIEVIFVRFIGNAEYQLPNWKHRDSVQGRQPHCIKDSEGANITSLIQPAPNERVFDKRLAFDAFFSEGFERYLRDRGFEHLVLTGLYTDVCVDSTARTAFQKGFFTTVVSDCTASLHIPIRSSLDFMKAVYGTRIVTQADLLGMNF